MPTLLTEAPPIPPSSVPPRKRWTREQFAPLEASGLFEQERLELVDGELISKMGKNRPHVKAFTWIHLWLLETFGGQFVNAEAPIDVSPGDNASNEPEPDLIVLKREFATFNSNPQPQDLDLVVEIAGSSLNFDLTVKAALYARAAIAEYWVLDIAGKRLIVHRSPVSGTYTSVAAYGEQEIVAPLAAPKAQFRPPRSSDRRCSGFASDGRGWIVGGSIHFDSGSGGSTSRAAIQGVWAATPVGADPPPACRFAKTVETIVQTTGIRSGCG